MPIGINSQELSMKIVENNSLKLSGRMRSSIAFGVIFAFLASLIYIIDSDFVELLRFLTTISSPIVMFGRLYCSDNPKWLYSIAGVTPFLFYGMIFGGFFNKPVKLSFKYGALVFICFLFTLLFAMSTVGILAELVGNCGKSKIESVGSLN
jgi:hypothetical protein